MEQIEIKSISDKLFVAFKDLYSISFPIFEQRTEVQQMKAFACPDYHLLCFVENEVFIGFIAYWELEHCLYIEHFAIHQLLRGKGYGSRVLKEYLKMANKTVVLEIDPITDEVSEARLHFYKRCGFVENVYDHVHSPYREGYKAHHLEVLSFPSDLTPEEYASFSCQLTQVVMTKYL